MQTVLGSARTGLIFTEIQEGNPGRDTAGQADPTWPNRAGYSIPCAVMLGSSGGGGAVGTLLQLGRAQRRFSQRERFCSAGSVLRGLFCGFVLCNPLFCIVVVPVPFVCSSVKLPLSRPTSFCLFLSILLRNSAGGGAAAWCFCCRLQPKPEHELRGKTVVKKGPPKKAVSVVAAETQEGHQ